MKERYRTLSAVMLLLTKEENGKEQILLQKRKNTGYMDGHWDCSVSGHVEYMESMKMAMQRETKEELFNVYDKDKITVTPYDKFESIIFNSHMDKELDDIEGAIVFNLEVH